MVLTIPPLAISIPREMYEEMMTDSFEDFKAELSRNIKDTDSEKQLLGVVYLIAAVMVKRVPFAEEIRKLADLTDQS